MLARYSAFVDRRRRPILLIAVPVALLLWAVPALPGFDISLLVVVVLPFVVGFSASDRVPGDLVVAADGFATPRRSTTVTAALSALGLVVFLIRQGLHDSSTRDAPWLALVAAYLLPLAACGFGLWRGTGLTLTPDGLRADKLTGAFFVPWTALAAEQFMPPAEKGHLFLRYARPEEITTVGRPIDLDHVAFAGSGSEFVAAAVKYYLAEPGRRPAIGTTAGLAELHRAVDGVEPAGLPLPAPTTRRRLRDGLAGVLLAATAAVLWAWTTDNLDWWTADPFLSIAVLAGLGLLGGAIIGAAPDPASPPAPPPTPAPPPRPPWARDVTGG